MICPWNNFIPSCNGELRQLTSSSAFRFVRFNDYNFGVLAFDSAATPIAAQSGS